MIEKMEDELAASFLNCDGSSASRPSRFQHSLKMKLIVSRELVAVMAPKTSSFTVTFSSSKAHEPMSQNT